MSGHRILKGLFLVFIGLILFLSLGNIYQSGEIKFPQIKNLREMIMKYWTDLQSYIQQESIKYIQSKFCVEDDQLKSEEECPKHRYIIRMIERSPLIIYIEKFLTQNEIDHLIKLA
jgi:hypothetical protein